MCAATCVVGSAASGDSGSLASGTRTSSGASSPPLNTAASPTPSVVSARAWRSSIAIAPASAAPVVGGHDPVRDLQVGVLDHVGRQPHRDLVGDHHALAVGADLGQQVGERLDRLPARVRPTSSAGRVATLPSSRCASSTTSRCTQLGRLPLRPPVLGQPDQEQPHEERLVVVVAQRLQLEHGRLAEQLLDRAASARRRASRPCRRCAATPAA